MGSALRKPGQQALPYVVFQRSPGSPYWVRFSIKGQGQIRKPLGTNDAQAAQRLARDVWAKATVRARDGLTAQNHRVKDVVDAWVAQLEREADRGDRPKDHLRRYGGIATRYIAGFWGDRDIEADPECVRNNKASCISGLVTVAWWQA